VTLQSLDQDACDLLLDGLVAVVEQVEDDPRVEVGVTVDVSELIHKAVQETQTSFVVQSHDDLLVHVIRVLLSQLGILRIQGCVSNEECYSVNDVRLDFPSSIDHFLRLHHLVANDLDDGGNSTSEVLF